MKQQPPLFKAAVRLVKHWAQQVHGQDWSNQLRNRWEDQSVRYFWQCGPGGCIVCGFASTNRLAIKTVLHDSVT
jgi:hypothetical protein